MGSIGVIMESYNGHRSWNAWNVSLWIDNTEYIYKCAMLCLERDDNNVERATNTMMRYYFYPGEKTPDGAVYNRLSVKLALEGLVE